MLDHSIVIGPSYELHDGVHGSLLEHPPPRIHYIQRRSLVHFDFPPHSTQLSPFTELAVGEYVSFTELPDALTPAHLSRTTYAGAGPWVVDADCLLATLQFGHFFPLESAARIRNGMVDPGALLLRQQNIIAELAAERCIAILIRTEWARRRLLGHLAMLPGKWGHAIETLDKKMFVVHPAVPVQKLCDFSARRTSAAGKVSVVYVGRTFRDKGGPLAISVMAQLRLRYGERIRLTLVGECPAPFHRACDAAMIRRLPITCRQEFRQLLAETDVFLSPTLFESFGMGILEAAAAGAAIVTSGGPGMEHIGELYRDGQEAIIVSNALPLKRRIEKYIQAISELIDHPHHRTWLRANCRKLTSSGQLSIAARDRLLLPVYGRLLATASQMRHEQGSTIAPIANVGGYQRRTWPEELCYWEVARRTGNSAIRIRTEDLRVKGGGGSDGFTDNHREI